MHGHYGKLALTTAINVVVMFLLTYALLADASHFHANVNRFYMAVMMAAAMLVVMLAIMGGMYENRRLTRAIMVGAAVLFVATLALARTQTPVGNVEFLRSMIPHHSSAVLMCRQGRITDQEILRLCDAIVRTQLEEIAQMEAILQRF